MVRAILDRLNRKWLYAILLFSLGLAAPYCFRGFFQTLSAQDTLSSTNVSYPEELKNQFEKAVKLSNAGKYTEAIAAYRNIIAKYPNYPEPYNNLAVLYAKTDQLGLAQQQLEKAMQTSQAYAAVYHNLGDVYQKMAADAYRKALHLDQPTQEPPAKLTMIASLSSQPSTTLAISTVEVAPDRTPQATKETAVSPQETTVVALNSTVAPETKIPDNAKQPENKPVETKSVETKPADKKSESTQPVSLAREDKAASDKDDQAKTRKNEVSSVVKNWASAWARQDTNRYLASYDRNFKVPDGKSRSAWEKDRKQRITEKDKIRVSVDILSVSFSGDDKATVRFRQRYEAGALKTSARKTMVLRQTEGGWKIIEERIG